MSERRRVLSALRRAAVGLAREESGNVAIIGAIAMPILVGGMALGTEVAWWRVMERQLQHAADLAALAGAGQVRSGDAATRVPAMGSHVAAESGADRAGDTVVVRSPPQAGAFLGDAAAVEAVIRRTQPRLLTAIFGAAPVTIEVRAVARNEALGTACVLALNPTARAAIDISGGPRIVLDGCSMGSNSTASDAIKMRGGPNVTAECLIAAGGIDIAHWLRPSLDCEAPQPNLPPIADPYAGVAEPAVTGTCKTVKDFEEKGDNYHDTLEFKTTENHPSGVRSTRFCKDVRFNRAAATFEPGLYILDGATLQFNNAADVTANGVTFFLTNGADFKFNGGSKISLSAPTSGPFSGLLFFADRSEDEDYRMNGGTNANFDGAFYIPGGSFRYNGGAATTGNCVQIIAGTFRFNGGGQLRIDCQAPGTREIPVGSGVSLVE